MDGRPNTKQKAPSRVDAQRGAKNEPGGSADKLRGRESMFPALVKDAARVARSTWPTWLGVLWLKNRRRAAP